MSATFTRTTALRASSEDVWRSVTSLEGINFELRPWMTMTAPGDLDGLSLDDDRVILGQPLFASTVRLLGILPMDRMHLTLVELEPGRRFVEESPMLTMRRWRHERTIEPRGDGCAVTDRITFAPRLSAATPLVQVALEAFFAHRHRQLVRRFGAA